MAEKITAENTFEVLRRHILVDGFPVVLDLEKSHGSHIIDAVTGKDYFDFFSFFASNPIGFNHPKMKEPEFLKTLTRCAQIKPVLADMYTPEYAQFVDMFARMCGRGNFTKYFFIEGGALAVENALKVAFDWKVKKNEARGLKDKGQQVIHFEQAFHGRTGYTMSLTNTDPKKIMHFPKFKWPRIKNPKMRYPVDPSVISEVEAAEKEAMRQIDEAFKNNLNDIACIILEPIQSEGGDNHFRPEFLKSLRKICDEREALLIFDEVQTGFGLTGKWWAYEHFGVKPDLLAFGKKAQIGGVACNNRVDDVENVFKISSRINSTFGGNLTDMVRCTQYMKIIQDENLVENAAVQGKYILEQMHSLSKKYPQMTNVRGLGLVVAFDLPTTAERDSYRRLAWDLGLLVLICGDHSIRLRPVLDIKKSDVDVAMSLFENTFKKLYS